MSDPKQVYERHVAAFNAKDPDADPWSADAEFIGPGARFRGREEIFGFMRIYWEAFPDARNEVDRLISEGSVVSAEGRFRGTHAGPLRTPQAELPPLGRRVEFRWSVTCEARGDELVSEHLYFDQVELLTQLGLLESTPAQAAKA
jgi:predicted ester cyclase